MQRLIVISAFALIACIILLGCSVEQSELAAQLPLQGLPGEFEEQEVVEPVAEKMEGSTLPYPDRENPFVFVSQDIESRTEAAKDGNSGLKLFGFMGDELPRVIFQMDGETKSLSVGDTWRDIEILQIDPPEVRIKFNGVIRNWSLLGNRELKAEGS